MIKLFLTVLLMFTFSTFSFGNDPLEEIDGTESWYEGTMEGNGDIVYYNESYEKDMKIYLAYLKSKQKNKMEAKSISYKVNRRKKHQKAENKDDEIGELGSIKEDDKLGDDLMNENDDNKKIDAVKIDKKEKNKNSDDSDDSDNSDDDDLSEDDLD